MIWECGSLRRELCRQIPSIDIERLGIEIDLHGAFVSYGQEYIGTLFHGGAPRITGEFISHMERAMGHGRTGDSTDKRDLPHIPTRPRDRQSVAGSSGSS